jgi:hypothetical protein
VVVIAHQKLKLMYLMHLIHQCKILAVFKSDTSVQLVPSQLSVTAVVPGELPPKTRPEVVVPAPLLLFLACI